MPRKPSRAVAVIAALALAACSSIGSINGQRLDVGNPPPSGTPPPVHQGYPCEDFEFLCIVGVGGLIALIVVLATSQGLAHSSWRRGDKRNNAAHLKEKARRSERATGSVAGRGADAGQFKRPIKFAG